MAGLLAARVLTDHFEQVTLVERDTFPAVGENRRGQPAHSPPRLACLARQPIRSRADTP